MALSGFLVTSFLWDSNRQSLRCRSVSVELGKKTLAMSVIRWQFYSLKNEPFNAIRFSGIDISVADFKDLVMKEKGMKAETSKLVVIDASNNEGNRVWCKGMNGSMVAILSVFLSQNTRTIRT